MAPKEGDYVMGLMNGIARSQIQRSEYRMPELGDATKMKKTTKSLEEIQRSKTTNFGVRIRPPELMVGVSNRRLVHKEIVEGT
ncbi:hypothetical protein HPP92_017343 [Vanilla planifolia]|uniref:Uncharacterized protein n=1 Tax=Vanilla planifolia TaxID=51239 RepID=A0A835QC69_VANPL|nr:hypothetical protein HPP92_017343 [Vanilla planifolia]